jgi:hypothetical protein
MLLLIGCLSFDGDTLYNDMRGGEKGEEEWETV